MDELSRFQLDGRVALVAGGSGGIGIRLCGALAGVSATVAIVGRSEERLQAARDAVEEAGSKALVLVADVTKEEDAERAVEETARTFGQLDILVNAVGGGAGAALHDAENYSVEDWDWIMDLNLRTQFLMSRAAARTMIANGRGGRILNVTALGDDLVSARAAAYEAASRISFSAGPVGLWNRTGKIRPLSAAVGASTRTERTSPNPAPLTATSELAPVRTPRG